MGADAPVTLVPGCSRLHGGLLQAAVGGCGADVRIVAGSTAETVRMGLRNVNNDACYETLAAVGSLLEAYDGLDGRPCRIVVPRLCAECRAKDTSAFAGRTFRTARGVQVEVADATAVLQAAGDESGTHLQQRIGLALWTGDIIAQSRCLLRPGASDERRALTDQMEADWLARARDLVEANDIGRFAQFCERTTAEAFEAAGPDGSRAPEVVLVGSAPAIFDDYMNAGAIAEFEREGCRVNLPTLSGYVRWEPASVPSGTELGLQLGRLGAIVRELDLPIRKLETRVRLRSSVTGVVPESLRYGDGWRIAARLAYQAEQGARNFVYISTFGCLSGHIMGKGVLRWARGLAPDIHVSAIEYDPGTSAVNQANRIKLIASLAKGVADSRTA